MHFPGRIEFGRGCILTLLLSAAALGVEKLDARIETSPASSPADTKARESLLKRATISWESVPLQTAADELAKLTSVKVQIDDQAFQAEKKQPKKITGKYQDQPLEEILWDLLPRHGMEYLIKDGAIVITTSFTADYPGISRTYNVKKLATSPQAFKTIVIGMAKSCHESIWESMGGRAVLKPDHKRGTVFVGPTREANHARISKYLRERLAEKNRQQQN